MEYFRDENLVLTHYFERHKDNDFSIYNALLDETTGNFIYRSNHSKISVKSLESYSEHKLHIEYDSVKTKIKKPSSTSSANHTVKNSYCDSNSDFISDSSSSPPSNLPIQLSALVPKRIVHNMSPAFVECSETLDSL